jgi:hypothetical protein
VVYAVQPSRVGESGNLSLWVPPAAVCTRTARARPIPANRDAYPEAFSQHGSATHDLCLYATPRLVILLGVSHLTEPWRKIGDDESDKERKETEQNDGYGKYSTAEQRTGQDGRNRLAIVKGSTVGRSPTGEELSEKFSYLPMLSFENYGFPRPSDGDDFNLDAIPLQEVLQQQISQQPGLTRSLSI